MSKDHTLKGKNRELTKRPPDILYQGTVSYDSWNNSAFIKRLWKGWEPWELSMALYPDPSRLSLSKTSKSQLSLLASICITSCIQLHKMIGFTCFKYIQKCCKKTSWNMYNIWFTEHGIYNFICLSLDALITMVWSFLFWHFD